MGASAKDREKELDRFIRRTLGTARVLIGVPAENATRGDGQNNAVLGYLHEFGDPEQNLPARPHLVPGVADAKDRIAKLMQQGAARAIEALMRDGGGREQAVAEVERTLQAVGLIGQTAVREKITDGDLAPLAPSTLAKRRRRGVSREKPLLDTGNYRRSINYTVRIKR